MAEGTYEDSFFFSRLRWGGVLIPIAKSTIQDEREKLSREGGSMLILVLKGELQDSRKEE